MAITDSHRLGRKGISAHSVFVHLKHKISASSTVQRSLQALENKETVQWVEAAHTGFYQVYDCFLRRWLAWKYQNLIH